VFIPTIFVSRSGKKSCFALIALWHNSSSSSSFFAFSSFVPARLSLLFSNCDVGPSYPAVTGLFITQTEHYTRTFYNSATERRPFPTRAKSKLSSNWNFVAVRQFVHYSRFFAESSTRPYSRLQLLFMPFLSTPPLLPPSLFLCVLCWLRVFAVYPGPFKVSIRDKHRFRVRGKVTSNWNFLVNRCYVSFATSIAIIEIYQTSNLDFCHKNDARMPNKCCLQQKGTHIISHIIFIL